MAHHVGGEQQGVVGVFAEEFLEACNLAGGAGVEHFSALTEHRASLGIGVGDAALQILGATEGFDALAGVS